jgi:L-serine dehydratase
LAGHPNAIRFTLCKGEEELVRRTYYSIGGGFIQVEGAGDTSAPTPAVVPYPFASAADLLNVANQAGLTIAELAQENEAELHGCASVDAGIHEIWLAMQSCVARGMQGQGVLPGGLSVKRRAGALRASLLAREAKDQDDPLRAMEWVNLYALAVNEENAAGGRVVTAPTNGAAGIIPAVLHYYDRFITGAGPEGIKTFLLAAAAIGAIIKRNASISGADVGCQGEVGSASAMAAAGLTAALGGSNEQVENAAEIALEHSLGLTCDPVGGLVQIPCIERNAVAAVKAINAARLALHGDGVHRVSLDQVIETMRQTGRDMKRKYKETSKGGLAVNVPLC